MGDPSSALPRFLFIPGGGMSSWVWRYLDDDLGSNGIFIDQRVPANTKEARRTVRISDCVRHIEERVGGIDESRIVVVAHSGGGVLAPIVAGRMSERVDWAQVPATVRMAYIRLTKDKTASVALQDRMAGNLAIREVHEIESDHMVMISHPDSFNRTIKTIVRGWAAHVRQR